MGVQEIPRQRPPSYFFFLCSDVFLRGRLWSAFCNPRALSALGALARSRNSVAILSIHSAAMSMSRRSVFTLPLSDMK